MSKTSVEIAMNTLEREGLVSRSGKYDENYFKLSEDERILVNAKFEEVFLSSRMLSLACNKSHYRSKQELQNDLVQGKNNYPTTFDDVIKFLSHHSLKDRSGGG